MKFLIITFILHYFLNFCSSTLPNGHHLPKEGVKPSFYQPVDFPCITCMQIITRFITYCASVQALKRKMTSFQDYCETLSLEESNLNSNKFGEFCKNILIKVADKKDKYRYFEEFPPNLCEQYQGYCDKSKIPRPFCFSGFCEKLIQCIDCPYGLVKNENDDLFELVVCSGKGICKLGSLSKDDQYGNGYCHCNEGYYGLACNMKKGEGIKEISFEKKENNLLEK